jgi:hypothetical protein
VKIKIERPDAEAASSHLVRPRPDYAVAAAYPARHAGVHLRLIK